MGQEVEFRVKTEDVTQGMGIYTPDMTLVAQVQGDARLHKGAGAYL